MEDKPSRYYVPKQSAWPIIGALALLILAFGSLNLNAKWGPIAALIGLGGLIFMLGGWLVSVTKESNAGLYNLQMDKTFRWGMFWFLFSGNSGVCGIPPEFWPEFSHTICQKIFC